MKVRKIPFDLAAAVRHENVESLTRDFERPTAFLMMAANVWSEWAEKAITYVRKQYGALDDEDDARIFVLQEARHAAALHQINRHLFGSDSYLRDPHLGRVPVLAHSVMTRRFQRLSEAEEGRFREPLQDFILYVTAFESTFNVISTASASRSFEAMTRDENVLSGYLEHAPFFYVSFYHNTEEAEHCHVSWDYYERTYGPIADIRSQFEEKIRENMFDLREICLRLSDAYTPRMEARELDEVLSPLHTLLLARASRFDMSMFDLSRHALIRSWDEVWEPRFRAAIEAALAASSIGHGAPTSS
jgi:hypothetical protein